LDIEIFLLKAMIKSPHILDYCAFCETKIVRCSTCHNNCCNGGYGQVNGVKCSACPNAYDMQAIYYKNPKGIKFTGKKAPVKNSIELELIGKKK